MAEQDGEVPGVSISDFMSQNIITFGSDKILELSNGQAGRMPIYGNSWTKIRIGVRVCFPALATLAGGPKFVMGVCNGPAGPTDHAYASAVTTNFCGIRSVDASWTLAGTVNTNAYGHIGSMKVIKKIGTIETPHASAIAGTTNNYVSMTDGMRSVYILQIEKGSPNYTFALCSPNGVTGAQHDVTDAVFLQLMEQDDGMGSPSGIVAGYDTKVGNNTLAVSEAAGDFDHINISWDRTSVKCHLSDVAHRLIA